MDKLPDEVLDIVFGNLHIFQKQECMLACRRWSNIIRSTSLFSTIHISRRTTFDRLIKVLDDNPSYRSQIQSLIIHDGFWFTIHEKELLHYFPRVRFVHHGSFELLLDKNAEPNKDLLVNLGNWRNQIEKMEIFWYQHENKLLFLGIFSGLKKLVINNIRSPSSFSDIVSRVPNINSLVIRRAQISLNDLESIHTGLKALHHLTLEDAYLVSGGELNYANTTNPITTLFISFQHSDDKSVIKWLQYITKNYNLLLNFRFISRYDFHISPERESHITRDGLVPLLQNLGHQLKYIEINSLYGAVNFSNTLSTLNNDKKIVRINTMIRSHRTTFGHIPVYDLGGFLHELTLSLNNVTSRKLSHFKYIRTLKKLKIGYMYQRRNVNKRVFLNEILNSISDSLESLEVYDFGVDSYSTVSRRHPLKKLAIHSSSISQNVCQLISNSLPSLNHLTIDQRRGIDYSSILLEGLDLQYLEISLNSRCLISLKTRDDRMSRYYSFDVYKASDLYSNDVSSVESYKPIQQTTFKTSPDPKIVLPVTCNCVKTFVVNKRLAF